MSPAYLVDDQGAQLRRAREYDFALVVGVDHYPRFRSLQGAVGDATAFHRWVCDPGGGAVNPARARLIVSKQDPATPVQDQIDEQLLELMIAADQLGGGRRLYFYFSGHGATSPEESGDDVALLLATWSKNLKRFALSSRGYSSELASVGLFEELVIFLDCCRTATVRAGRPAPGHHVRRDDEPALSDADVHCLCNPGRPQRLRAAGGRAVAGGVHWMLAHDPAAIARRN